MFVYHNANPRNRNVNDCTVRAISLATGRSWDATFEELAKFAQAQAIMPDEVDYIDEYLERKFNKVFCANCRNKKTVGEIVNRFNQGTYLITMSGHITCAIDGVIYDTFDPSSYFVWNVYRI